jgi:hypothetical protein
MAALTFIVIETPDPGIAKAGAQMTLEQAAQLLEVNAHDLFTQAYLAASVMHCGFVLRVVHDPEAKGLFSVVRD